MGKIAVLMTVHNRKEKTLRCLSSLEETLASWRERFELKVFLTDDGCTDGTAEAVRRKEWSFPVEILQGDGTLFWNGGMILAWKAAISESIRRKDADLKGSMASQGTTPRQLTDLIGSLCDLTSGSGDKGTPVVLVQGYFDNYTN